MIVGLHHGGRSVTSLTAATNHLTLLSEWEVAGHLDANHPLLAGTGVRGGALLKGPNGFIELLHTTGADATRRTVAEPGISHLSIQLPDMAAKNAQLVAAEVERHNDPVELGTGFSYLYVRDGEHNVTEIEGAGHAPSELTPWFSHVGIATHDLNTLRSVYEAAFGNPAIATIRFGDNPNLDAVTALDGAEVTMTWVPAGNARVELLQFHNPATPAGAARPLGEAGVGHLCLEVDDLTVDVEAGLAAGLTMLHGPDVRGGIGLARLADPDGNVVEYVAFEREDHPLSLRTVDSLHIYPQVDALLYGSNDG